MATTIAELMAEFDAVLMTGENRKTKVPCGAARGVTVKGISPTGARAELLEIAASAGVAGSRKAEDGSAKSDGIIGAQAKRMLEIAYAVSDAGA